MKTVPQLDAAGYIVGMTVADESPREPGIYLIPAGAVDLAMPDVPLGKRARLVGQSFVLEDIPASPVPPDPTPLDGKSVRIAQIDAALDDIDQRSIRPAREIASALAAGLAAPVESAAKLAELDALAVPLRAERTKLIAA